MDGVRLVEILLVEDNPDEVLLTRETLKDARVANRVHVAADGEEAMEFVRRGNGSAEAPRPDLILLDLNLPRKDGREVLAELKRDEDLKRIPVIVLTTSASDRDLLEAYDKCVNAYVRKPVSLDRFIEVVNAIDEFWLGVVALPHGQRPY
jgi:chemotaxis family two-component system response regulator Rcp1